MDLATGAHRYLNAQSSLTALLGSSTVYDHWLFRGRLYVGMEGTGTQAVVVSERGGWAAPNATNTMRFPVLQIEIYADSNRGADLNPVFSGADAETKARLVFDAIDPFLHYVKRNGEMYWGGTSTEQPLRVLGSLRANEPDVTDVPGGDGLVRLLVRYQVVLG